MRCVQIDANGLVVDVVPQPSDFTGCALVLVSGADGAPYQIPDSAVLADAFEFGASMVLFCGLVGFLIGRFVRFFSEE